MEQQIVIAEKPDWVAWQDIHDLLSAAHERNRSEGFHVKTADMPPEQLEKHIGEEGRCFVALDGRKLVGVTAVRAAAAETWYAKGLLADQILVAVHPDYTGRHISSKLHQEVVSFAAQAGLKQIMVRTAYNNTRMQNACRKWGFRYVDFKAYSGIDHYTVVMLKWPEGCPFPRLYLSLRYLARKTAVRMIARRGRKRPG